MPEGKADGHDRPAPPRSGTRRAERYFTTAEANAMLPGLERQVEQVQSLYRQARENYTEVKRIQAVGLKDDGTLIMAYDYRVTKEIFDQLVKDMESAIEKITQQGCQLKHIEMGLIDFPSILDGEEVLLCWRMGEAMVGYYHGFDEGYTGRRPLPRD